MKALHKLFPLGFNDNIYHQGNNSKFLDFDGFSLFDMFFSTFLNVNSVVWLTSERQYYTSNQGYDTFRFYILLKNRLID